MMHQDEKDGTNDVIEEETCLVEIIKKKFKCIILILLIIIMVLDIFKTVIPSLSIEDQQTISKGMLNAANSFINVAKKHFNMTIEETRTHDHSVTMTATTTEMYLTTNDSILNVTTLPEYG